MAEQGGHVCVRVSRAIRELHGLDLVSAARGWYACVALPLSHCFALGLSPSAQGLNPTLRLSRGARTYALDLRSAVRAAGGGAHRELVGGVEDGRGREAKRHVLQLGLAERVRRAGEVELVVDDLEREA